MKTTFLATLFLAAAVPATAEVDPCLVGTWRADPADLAHVMTTVMGAESSSVVEGEMIMNVYPEANVRLSSTTLTYDIRMPGTPPIQVTVRGHTNATIETAGVSFWTNLTGGALEAEAAVLGTVIPMTDPPALIGGASGIYGCTDEGLSFEPDGPINSIPRKWTRIE